jgi:hypothetical protein
MTKNGRVGAPSLFFAIIFFGICILIAMIVRVCVLRTNIHFVHPYVNENIGGWVTVFLFVFFWGSLTFFPLIKEWKK